MKQLCIHKFNIKLDSYIIALENFFILLHANFVPMQFLIAFKAEGEDKNGQLLEKNCLVSDFSTIILI